MSRERVFLKAARLGVSAHVRSEQFLLCSSRQLSEQHFVLSRETAFLQSLRVIDHQSRFKPHSSVRESQRSLIQIISSMDAVVSQIQDLFEGQIVSLPCRIYQPCLLSLGEVWLLTRRKGLRWPAACRETFQCRAFNCFRKACPEYCPDRSS